MKPTPQVLELLKEIVMDRWRDKKSEYTHLLTDIDRE
jgi:hypothetical protein